MTPLVLSPVVPFRAWTPSAEEDQGAQSEAAETEQGALAQEAPARGGRRRCLHRLCQQQALRNLELLQPLGRPRGTCRGGLRAPRAGAAAAGRVVQLPAEQAPNSNSSSSSSNNNSM